MQDCVFCKIVKGEIPAEKVYEDDKVIAFKDINPQAPVHVLIVPKEHRANLLEYGEEDEALLGHVLVVAAKIAKRFKIDEAGFRVVINTNRDAGQQVFHLHAHVLGGRKMGWPPG